MEHPSNKLYHGECSNLEEAIALVKQELSFELRTMTEDEIEKYPEIQQGLKEVESLEREYYAKIESVRSVLMEEWQKRGEWAKGISDAYKSGDYSELAI